MLTPTSTSKPPLSTRWVRSTTAPAPIARRSVEAVVDDHGVAADAVEDAIQDALMSGKCYEPGDGTLKPI